MEYLYAIGANVTFENSSNGFRTEKTQQSQFYHMNIAGLHLNICCAKQESFENLNESRTVTVCIGIFLSVVITMHTLQLKTTRCIFFETIVSRWNNVWSEEIMLAQKNSLDEQIKVGAWSLNKAGWIS